MAKITYDNKETLNSQPSIADKNKVKAEDMNEIKSVVNTNYGEVGDITNLNTTDKSSIVNAVNELKGGEEYSTNEINTGKTWIDGKPIYRKVVELPNITSTNIDIGVACNISNLWQVINIEGIIYINNSQGDLGIPLNFYNKASQDYSFLTFYRKTTSQIIMRVWTATKGGFAILYYTKTTD